MGGASRRPRVAGYLGTLALFVTHRSIRAIIQTAMRIIPGFVVALAILITVGTSTAADTCTPVRPPGLSAEAVDQTVLRKVAETLQVPTERIDPRKTIKELDPSDNVPITYTFAVSAIAEALAFDSAAAFYEANKATGKQYPWEGLTVATMQILARKAYFAGTDAPPPSAPGGATFKTQRFSVAVPSQPSNWSLMVCTHDRFAFRSQDARAENVYTAAAGDIRLEPFKNDKTFLDQVRADMALQVPTGHAMTSIDVRMLQRSGPPCALASGELTATAPPAQTSSKSRYTIYARFCYDSKYPYLGYLAYFSHQGRASAADVRAMAMSYIDGVKAAR